MPRRIGTRPAYHCGDGAPRWYIPCVPRRRRRAALVHTPCITAAMPRRVGAHPVYTCANAQNLPTGSHVPLSHNRGDMLPTLRSALRAVSRALRRPPPSAAAGSIERWRVELLLNAVARNLRNATAEMPPSFAMLEVLVREVPADELAAMIQQLGE